MAKYCFGIDVGGTTVKCGLFTVEGELLDKWEIKTRTEDGGSFILPDVAETIQNKMKEREIEDIQVKGVGVGVPGPVNSNGEIPCAVNLNWGSKNIEIELSMLTGFAVKAGNDANVAALGEMWKGGGEGKRNLIMATLGTGVGGGIIVNGKMVVGAHGAGGEIGHAVVNVEETMHCNCGNAGCLEQYASATGIARMAKMELEEYGKYTVLRKEEHISAKSVIDAYKSGDDLAAQIMERFAKYLGSALAGFSCVVDPDIIVIGGGVSKAGDVLTEVIGKYYRQYAFSACKDTPIVLARLGNDAGIYGAAKMILDEA